MDLKYLILSSLISRFVKVFFNKLVFIKVNTAKWWLISVFIIPLCTSESIMVLVSTWSIIAPLDFVTLVGLFTRGKTPFWKIKLKKSRTFLFIEYSKEFMLRSPTKNRGFPWFLQITAFISTKNLCQLPFRRLMDTWNNCILGVFSNNFDTCTFYVIAVNALSFWVFLVF